MSLPITMPHRIRTPLDLAEALGIKPDSVRVNLKQRWKLIDDYRSDMTLQEPIVQEALNRYASSSRVADVRDRANSLLGEAPVATPLPAPKPARKKAAPKAKPAPVAPPIERRLEAKQVLVLIIALVGMSVQVVHTAAVCQANETHWWTPYAYALAIQFTGLVLTLYKGAWQYLLGFAIAEFCINMLYYRPWATGGLEVWSKAVMLSLLLAFTIFSYSEIFAAMQRPNTAGHA